MKTKFYLAILLSVLVVSSCSKEDDDIPSPTPTPTPVVDGLKEITFYVTLPQVLTRASMEEEGKFVWNAGDAISVFDGVANREFKTTQSGEKVAFTGKVKEASNYYIVYPYQSGITVENGVIKGITLPSTQKAIAGGIDPKLNVSVGTLKSGASDVSLSNVFAYSRFSVDGEQAADVRSITITANDETPLSGAVTIDLNTSTPKAQATSSTPGNITLITENGMEVDKDYFFAVIPSVLSNGMSLTFTNLNSDSWTKEIDSELMLNVDKESTFLGRTDLKFLGNDMIEITFYATLPKIETRASMDEEGKFVWTAGDAISVFDGVANREFTTTQSGEKVAFTGEVKKAANYYLIYPYQSDITLENGVIKGFSVPKIQKLLSKEQLISSSINVAKVQENETEVQFINIGKTISFVVYGTQAADIRSVTLSSNSDVSIAGNIEIDYTGINPIINASSDSQTITLETEEGLEQGREYCISVIPTIIPNGITLSFKNSKGEMWQEVINESIDFTTITSKSIPVNLNPIRDEMLLTDKSLIRAAEDECKHSFEKDSNGYVSLKNKYNYNLVKSIKSLHIYPDDYGIDLSDEIRHFSSVEELTCSTYRSVFISDLPQLSFLHIHGNLTSTDYLSIKNCPNLKNVIISQTLLSFLDLSGIHSLDSLLLDANIKLKKLNIAGNRGIKYFESRLNKIESLDFSGCSSLEEITIGGGGYMIFRNETFYGNYLSNINLKGCYNLKQLTVPDNKLYSIDISDCVNLNWLYINNNQITRIDLSTALNLEQFDCSKNPILELDLSACKQLEFLLCNETLLSELNVSENKRLHGVYCQKNNIKTLDFSNLKDLMSIECNNCSLTKLNLTGCSTVNYLRCYNNSLTELDISDTSLKRDEKYKSFWYLPQATSSSTFTLYVNENQYSGFTDVNHKVVIKK